MNLYVTCKGCGTKIYIESKAKTRQELYREMGKKFFTIKCPVCGNIQRFSVNDVMAEAKSDTTLTGTLLGGLAGMLLGPLGAAAGAITGGIIGLNEDTKEEKEVRKFNNSYV